MRRIDVLLGKKLPYTLACKHYQSYVSITFCFVLDLIAMLEDVLAHETSFIESFEPIHHSALSSALQIRNQADLVACAREVFTSLRGFDNTFKHCDNWKKLHSIKYHVWLIIFLNTAIITLGIDHAVFKAFHQNLLFLVFLLKQWFSIAILRRSRLESPQKLIDCSFFPNNAKRLSRGLHERNHALPAFSRHEIDEER